MAELNSMAKEMGIENFGTNEEARSDFPNPAEKRRAQRHLVRRGVLKFCRKVSASCALKASTIAVSGGHLRFAVPNRRFDLQTGDVVSGQIRPPKE